MPLHLLWRHLLARPLRSLLTIGSVAIAVFLIAVLDAAVAGLERTIAQAAANRLFVQSAVSLYVDLPLSYQQKMNGVQGIDAICKWQWFGGRYEQDKGGFFAQFGIDADTWLSSYPELAIVEGSYEEFARERTACIVGADLADQYGWTIGQTVPITGTIFQRTDRGPWEFTIRGVYRSSKTAIDQQTMYFHYDYLRESLENGGATGPQGVGVYMLRLQEGADAVQVASDVDGMFANGPQVVQTTTEAEFNRQFLSMLGNVPALLRMIGGAVLFAIFFAVLNTMLLAARERTREVGVLKALGFGNGTIAGLLIGESLLLCALGAAAGAAIAKGLEPGLQKQLASRLPGYEIDLATLLVGTGLALAVGLVSGLVPGRTAARVEVVAALKEVG